MKLWQKIVAISGAVLLGAVGTLFLQSSRMTRESIFYLTARRLADTEAQAETLFLKSPLPPESGSDALRSSVLRRNLPLRQYPKLILLRGGTTVYAPVSLTEGRVLRIPGMELWQCLLYEKDGESILCVGRETGEGLILYSFDSVSEEVQQYRSFLTGFFFFAAAAVLSALLAVFYLVRRSMLPLQKLEFAAARIAEGNYSQRTGIQGSDEVGLLAKSFDAMAQSVEQTVHQLQDTANRQQRFLSAVTHEFKTPLSGQLLALDALQNVCMDEQERMQMLAGMERECRHLETMVRKLMKLITLGQPPELQEVETADFLRRLWELAQPIRMQREIRLEIQGEGGVLSFDPELMETALLNLIENAAKASPPGSTVVLTGDSRGFSVTDHGRGMDPELIPRITEPFYTADPSRSKKQGGIGLGLALVQGIVDAHGGKLVFDSAPGKGTTVRIIIKP